MKLRRCAGLARFVVLGFLLGGVMAGCSSAAMKTTPLWDSEYEGAVGPPEDRINVWPLFYYRNPAYSILWPLISVTPDGHAFVPFYEYNKPEDSLRVGTLHQWIPAIADFDRRDQWSRVLNVIWDREEKEFWVAPIYYQDFDDSSLWILPVFAKGKTWFWTPLYTQTKHLKGVLGPLFFIRREGESRAAFYPLPFLGNWKSANGFGYMALPFVFYNRTGEDKFLNIAAILFHRNKQGETERMHFLWPLGAAGKKGDEQWNRLIPLWYSKTDENGKRFLSLPFTRIEKEDLKVTNALLNGYVGIEGKNNKYESFIFPFFHRFKTADAEGHAAFPLYALFNNSDGTRTIYSPLVNFRDDGSFINIAGPTFYYSDRNGTKKQAVLWPFSFWWKSENESGSWVLPFWYRRKDNDGNEMLATLGGGYSRSGDVQRASVLGPIYYQRKHPNSLYRTVVWPLFHQWSNQGGSGQLLFPLYTWSRHEEGREFYSLLYSGGHTGESKFFDVGPLLFGRTWSPTHRKYRMLGPIAGVESYYSEAAPRERESLRHWIFPLYSASNTKDRKTFRSIMTRTDVSKRGVEGEKRELIDSVKTELESRDKNVETNKPAPDFQPGHFPHSALVYERRYLLGLGAFERWVSARALSKEETVKAGDEITTVTVANSEPSAIRIEHERKGRFFPLFSYKSKTGEGGKFNILWRLYDSDTTVREDGEEYSRRRVLWRVFHRERLGDRVSTDIFPFIAYDRAENLLAWSFAGGFLGYENEAGGSTLKLLYLPIRWGKQSSAENGTSNKPE